LIQNGCTSNHERYSDEAGARAFLNSGLPRRF
jgi:hypothetical protein